MPLRPARAVRATLIAWGDAIRSLPISAWKWAGLIGLFGTTLQCALILGEAQPSVPLSALLPVCGAAGICWGAQVTLGLGAWAIADRSGVATERRAGRLAIALTVATVAAAQRTPQIVRSQLVWVDRAGKKLATVTGLADFGNIELSPDRRQIARRDSLPNPLR